MCRRSWSPSRATETPAVVFPAGVLFVATDYRGGRRDRVLGGGVAERFMASPRKGDRGATFSRVRIPPPPLRTRFVKSYKSKADRMGGRAVEGACPENKSTMRMVSRVRIPPHPPIVLL